MTAVQANGITIEYESIGDVANPPLVLIMGLGSQLTHWPDDFCHGLAERGFRVIRFDNRDVGLSTRFEEAGVPNLRDAMTRAAEGKPVDPPYRAADMAADMVGLLDALRIETAHIVGLSMGGMIGQHIAANHGGRVRSFVSIMSSSGNPNLPPGTPEGRSVLVAAPQDPTSRDSIVDHAVWVYQTIAGPAFPWDEEDLRRHAARSIDRAYHPAGAARQTLAVLADGSRVEMLKRIAVPTLVIHGSDDPLLPVEGGKDTAANIPGAELRVIEGMGHNLAPPLRPILIDAIAAHCARAN